MAEKFSNGQPISVYLWPNWLLDCLMFTPEKFKLNKYFVGRKKEAARLQAISEENEASIINVVFLE